MDGTELEIDPHNEVRKLQELVKKLERQNEVLRSKQPSDSSVNIRSNTETRQNGDAEQLTSNGINSIIDESHEESIQTTVQSTSRPSLDDYELIDFGSLSEEESSWLHKDNEQDSDFTSEFLESWCRQFFDERNPIINSVRMDLSRKIDELYKMKHSSSSPMLGGQPLSRRSPISLNRSAENKHSSPSPTRVMPAYKNSNKFDSGTFTRPKRFAPMHGEGDQVQETPSVPDADEIQHLAKQQEESLRQSMRPSNRNAMRAKQVMVDGDNSARLSPSRFDADGAYFNQHRGSLGSDHSTPPDSPHSYQHPYLNNANDLKGRRNISNSGLQYKSHNSSDSSLEQHSVGSDDMNLAPEAIRTQSSRIQQPNYRTNTTLTAAAKRGGGAGITQGLSQNRRPTQMASGLPAPTSRRQIMRPSDGPRTSLPTFRRPTTAPAQKSMEYGSGNQEESWRDGCF